jgi:hypothetical protein
MKQSKRIFAAYSLNLSGDSVKTTLEFLHSDNAESSRELLPNKHIDKDACHLLFIPTPSIVGLFVKPCSDLLRKIAGTI